MMCKNCTTPLSEGDKFCNECGAKVIDHRLTMRYLASECYQGFFSIDSSRPVRTFLDLFRRPEDVIVGYINGIRKKYINAFGYFTIAVTVSSIFFFIILKFFPQTMEFMSVQQAQNNAQAALSSEINKVIFENQSLVFFISIPILALISRLLFLRNKTFNYAEHLVLNLYTYSQISLVSVLFYLCTIWWPEIFFRGVFVVLIFQMLYYAYVLKRVYELSLWKIILKTLLFFLIMIPFFIILSIGIFFLMMALGVIDMQQFIEAEKAKQAVGYIVSSAINWTS